MTLRRRFEHNFVDLMPPQLEEGIIYVSIPHSTAIHLCACGCGQEVVTPIASTEWTLLYHGDAVSLDPSIGNWSFHCQSHYWIDHNRVVSAPRWSRARIDAGRAMDTAQKKQRFQDQAEQSKPAQHHDSLLRRVWTYLSRKR